MIDFRIANFLASFTKLEDLSLAKLPQIAFAGRSNAGKSSLLNMVCDQKKLARTSQHPGRTQQLVFFELKNDRYLVDLPGYGYAKASKSLRASWGKEVENYLRLTPGLNALVLVVDSRRMLQELDEQMIDFASHCDLKICLFFTKADKLKSKEKQIIRQLISQIEKENLLIKAILGSSFNKQGLLELHQWLTINLGWSDDHI